MGIMLFDSEQEAQNELDRLGSRAIIGRLELTYEDGSTAVKWAVNRIIMGGESSGGDMRVEWLNDDGQWRQ